MKIAFSRAGVLVKSISEAGDEIACTMASDKPIVKSKPDHGHSGDHADCHHESWAVGEKKISPGA